MVGLNQAQALYQSFRVLWRGSYGAFGELAEESPAAPSLQCGQLTTVQHPLCDAFCVIPTVHCHLL